VEKNISAVMMDESSFMQINVTYAAPGTMSGFAVFDEIEKFWSGDENSLGQLIMSR
jgi:hypothetical protein